MLKIAILHTDLMILYDLEAKIKTCLKDITYQLYKFGFAVDLLDFLNGIDGQVDVIMIGIDLNQEDGIQVATTINKAYPKTKNVLMSEKPDQIEEMFEASPAYFLYIPISEISLMKCLNCLWKRIRKDNGRFLSLIKKNRVEKIQTEDIEYVESDKRIVIFHLTQETVEYYEKLNNIQELLGEGFLRCHQSYIVNIDRIKSLQMEGIELYSGASIPISRDKYYAVKREYINYIARM